MKLQMGLREERMDPRKREDSQREREEDVDLYVIYVRT